MNRNMRGRLIQTCLLAAVLQALPAMVQAQYTYTTNNGAITITGYTGTNDDVTIPDTINGLPVTSIGDQAFQDCISLTNVIIPNSVTSILSDAFDDCTSLTSVTIPDSVIIIGAFAFADCTNLTSVTIPKSVTIIRTDAFENCVRLTTAYFLGNSPPGDGDPYDFGDADAFVGDPAIVYYLAGTTGWGPTFGDVPAVLWNSQAHAPGFTGSQFGFNLTGPTNAVIVVEASTNLSNQVWLPVGTNTLVNGSSYFSDPQWTNYPARFYWLRSP
jgi:BspA type Leucine rich repeat region (6 copies)